MPATTILKKTLFLSLLLLMINVCAIPPLDYKKILTFGLGLVLASTGLRVISKMHKHNDNNDGEERSAATHLAHEGAYKSLMLMNYIAVIIGVKIMVGKQIMIL